MKTTRKASQADRGDKVSFTARGKKLKGVVLRRRIKTRRGKTRRLAYRVTGDASSLDQEVVEITADDGAVWTVGVCAIDSIIGTASAKERDAAHGRKSEIKSKRALRRNEVKRQNIDAIDANNLDSLRIGDDVEIAYRGGYWKKCVFKGFVSGSGKVRFVEPYTDRVRFAHPQHARPVQSSK